MLFDKFLTSITWAFLSIFGFLTTPCLGQVRQGAESHQVLHILAFGDSLTAGYQVLDEESYPRQLQKLLEEQGYKVKITNGGVSGDTSAQGLRRLDWNLKANKYDWVLLGLGANDGLRNKSLSEMETNLEKIVLKLKQLKINVLLLGMRLPKNYNERYRKEFESIYPKLSKKHGLPYVSFMLENIALNSKLTLDDQIHPNPDGYKIVAKRIYDVLSPLLPKK